MTLMVILNCFVIVYNMSQKVFRDCMGLKRLIWIAKGLFGQDCGLFKGLFG